MKFIFVVDDRKKQILISLSIYWINFLCVFECGFIYFYHNFSAIRRKLNFRLSNEFIMKELTFMREKECRKLRRKWEIEERNVLKKLRLEKNKLAFPLRFKNRRMNLERRKIMNKWPGSHRSSWFNLWWILEINK